MSDIADALTTTPEPSWPAGLVLGVVFAACVYFLLFTVFRRRMRAERLLAAVLIGVFTGFPASASVGFHYVDRWNEGRAAALAHYLEDSYGLVAMTPISVRGDHASLLARTRDGYDLSVEVDWSELLYPSDPAQAYLPDMDLPASAHDQDPFGGPVHVSVEGWPMPPGVVEWDADDYIPVQGDDSRRDSDRDGS